MNTAVITDMMQEGMWVVIQIAAPMLLLSMFAVSYTHLRAHET